MLANPVEHATTVKRHSAQVIRPIAENAIKNRTPEGYLRGFLDIWEPLKYPDLDYLTWAYSLAVPLAKQDGNTL
jgi:hypothetical protein